MTSSGEVPDAGETIVAGRYRVEQVLGQGGMGAVYRVRDLRTDRGLALKRGVGRDARKASKRRALLEREYHTLAQLAHPRIIEVYDYGVDDQGPYYTMELLDGSDLDRRGRLPWRDACALLCDVASSLAILHSRGLLHRDVSSRNVRCTADGRAKLLDFGAMTTMGSAKDVVGTPPFVAPEALALQALDARADLFSLGALGYYLLTARHAYPARRLSELRDVWRSSPPAPVRLVAELPEALSELIMQLVSLDRGARPQSAGEVMERLGAIAGLPMQERIEVTRAYLATPTLIGRERALVAMRKRMLSLVRGEGGVLLVEGDAGSGRSRLLDACVLEAKLLGATVLRADQSDGTSEPFGVTKALCGQLLELFPAQAADASRLSRSVLSHVISGLHVERRSSPGMPERSVLLRELRDFVLALSRGQRLVIVVDDVDRIDEPSAALLAALAHKTDRHAVVLALAAERDAAATFSPLRLLREIAEVVDVAPFDAEQSEALLRAVFGDVANLSLVAGRVHALAQGNPRATMELAHHLVERNLARYEAGSWSLPQELVDGNLPASLSASLEARLSPLGPDAREICDLLCLSEGEQLALDDYDQLCEHHDSRRVFAALDELIAARILTADGERYRLSQRGFLPVLQTALSDSRRQALSVRLADRLVRVGNGSPRMLAEHLLDAGREREAVELLAGLNLYDVRIPVPLLERALAAAERLGMPARSRHDLRSAVLTMAPTVFAAEAFYRHLPQVLAQLERDSGLAMYRELADLPSGERLAQALARTQARFDATEAHDRVYPILDAIRELARFSASFCSLALLLMEPELFDALPSLEPLMSLSPSLTIIGDIIDASKLALCGRAQAARVKYDAVLARLREPDRGGFDESYARGVSHGLHYLLGLMDASMAISRAEEHAVVLERDREHRVNAWRLRVSLHLNQGDAEQARKCLRRAELLQLQEGADQRYLGTTAGFELLAQGQIGDLIAVKRCLEPVSRLARHYPGWRSLHAIGECYYRSLSGDAAGALAALQPVLPARAGRHPYFCYIAAAHLSVLCDLGQVDEAIALGRAYYEDCRTQQVDAHLRWLQRALGLALARGQQYGEALELLDHAISTATAQGIEGLSLGALYEARVWAAAGMNDKPGFERAIELCAAEYQKAQNPALNAKFARLIASVRQKQHGAVDLGTAAAEIMVASQTETGFETIQSRMLECIDGEDRARCALTMMLQSIGSVAGHLYGIHEDCSLTLLAALPDEPAEPELERWLNECLRLEFESSQTSATATADGDDEAHGDPRSEVSARYTDEQGRSFEPLFLGSGSAHGYRVAALLALQVMPGPRSPLPKELIAELADYLLDQGDVDGMPG